MICPKCDEDLVVEVGNTDTKYQDIDLSCPNNHNFYIRLKANNIQELNE